MQNNMKTLLTFLLLAITVSGFGQTFGDWEQRWEVYMKPQNPYKWYTVKTTEETPKEITRKIKSEWVDIAFKGESTDVVKFQLDSAGNPLSSPHKNTTWIYCYFHGDRFNDTIYLEDALIIPTLQFNSLPFGCENGVIGLSEAVNQAIANYFKVPIENVSE